MAVDYQSTKSAAKALYVLDNLWDGLGALTVLYPEIRYLFGKVTMYPNYGAECRDMLLGFINKYFRDPDNLVSPIKPLPSAAMSDEVQSRFNGGSYREDYRILNHFIRSHGQNIPPLVNAYIALSPTMRMFGTAVNDHFGDVEESGIFFKISEIYPEKKERHIDTFRKMLQEGNPII